MRLSILIAATCLLAVPPAFGQPGMAADPPQEEIGARVIGDGVVVAGQRVGPLHLGMSIDQMLRRMPPGYTREVFSRQHVVLYEWRAQGVWISLDEPAHTVRLISVFGTGPYKTDKGVYLLDAASKMQKAYGVETRRYNYPEDRITLVRYVPAGLQFGLVNQPSSTVLHGRIFTIGVFTPGREPPLTKPPSGTN